MNKHQNLFRPFILAALLAAGACNGGGFEAADIADQTVQGSVNGSSWSAVMPQARLDSDGDLSVTLYGETREACGFGLSSELPTVLFSVPAVVGEYPLKFEFSADDQTTTFYVPPSQNIIASEGLIVVESVSTSEITIAMVVEAGDNHINGRFTVALCE